MSELNEPKKDNSSLLIEKELEESFDNMQKVSSLKKSQEDVLKKSSKSDRNEEQKINIEKEKSNSRFEEEKVSKDEINNRKKEEEKQTVIQKCDKCSGEKKNYMFSCNHHICINCLITYFMSTNLSNLTLEDIKFKCMICNNGEYIFSVDEWIMELDELQKEKEEKNRTLKILSQKPKKKCFAHKDQEVVGYCVNCKLWLCEQCKTLFHNQFYPGHQFSLNEEINIFCDIHKDEITEFFCLTCQKNVCKLCVQQNGKHDLHRYISQDQYKTEVKKENGQSALNYQNYDEFETILKNFETNFFQKLEDDYIRKKEKIDEFVDILERLKDEYSFQTDNFKIKMDKIFTLIRQSYFNYFSDKKEDKDKIRFQSSLTDIALVSKKKANLDELFVLFTNQLKSFETIENPENNPQKSTTLNYQLVWNNNHIKEYKKYSEHQESVTKLLKMNSPGLIATASVDSNIIIWNLDNDGKINTLKGHKNSIWCLCQDKNGILYSGSSDKTINIWMDAEYASGYLYKTLKGHKGTIYTLAISKSNNLLSGSDDKTIKVWDINTCKCIYNINVGAAITSIGILIDNFIICGADDNKLKLVNLNKQEISGELIGHGCTVWCVTVFEDAIHIASGSSDNSIKIWDLNAMKLEYSLEGHQNTISSLKILKNGILASSSWDSTIKFWNLASKLCIFSLEGHKGIIYDIIEMDDGKIISCSEDKKVIAWERV